MNRSPVSGVQGLRAIAALLVLVQHVTYFACYAKGLDLRSYLPMGLGATGVGLFFVISGYVMGECLPQGKRFMLNRLLRILPPFWLAILVAGVVLLGSNTGWHIDLKSVFLLPSDELNNSYRIPYWTLCYEMAFYAAVYVMILAGLGRDRVAVACLLWIVAISAFDMYTPTHVLGLLTHPISNVQPGYAIWLSPLCIFFLAGLFLSTAGTDVMSGVPTLYLALGAISFWWLGNALTANSLAPLYLIQSASYACALLAALRTPAPKALARLGDFSYGIYLMHFAPLTAALTIIAPHAANMRLTTVWLVFAAIALSCGTAFGWLEFVMHTRLKIAAKKILWPSSTKTA